jgi:arylsulfatase A-like enzyme
MVQVNYKNAALCLVLALSISFSGNAFAHQKKKPTKKNIIFFMVDDMGWMDCSEYGSEYYETPNVERLAKMGVKFTQAYAANPLCSPTRASIMTGRYPSRFNFTMAMAHKPPNPDEDMAPPKEAAPFMKMVTPGVRHFMPLDEITIAEVLKQEGYVTGHIGKWHLGAEGYWPKDQGFDINVGGWGMGWPPTYFSPYKIETLEDGPKDEYLVERLNREALKFIEDHQDTCFYLNLWHYAVHGPWEAKKELVEKYTQKKDPRGRQNDAVMAAMIESVDNSLGVLLDKLEALDMMENTIIIFFSDNGGNMYNVLNDGTVITNNYPLKSGKANVHEGGIRVPCVVYWPNEGGSGAVSDETICSIDFFPTILDMIGLKDVEMEREIDGKSIVPALKNNGSIKREGIFIDFPHYIYQTGNYPSHVVIDGDWKLIRVYGEGPKRENYYELYNLAEDIKEEINLAAFYPKRVEKMDELIENHLSQVNSSRPLPNPAYNPKALNPVGDKLKRHRVKIK